MEERPRTRVREGLQVELKRGTKILCGTFMGKTDLVESTKNDVRWNDVRWFLIIVYMIVLLSKRKESVKL